MNVKYFITLILLALTIVVYGQNRTVSGTVTDEIGEPLIGVNVVYGPGLGVVTDMDGAYSLTLPQGNYELSVSYVGFEPQSKQITVSGKKLLP